jgi:Holliday junction resolvasome RuvABC ATP-dependent DNA helicase subunit
MKFVGQSNVVQELKALIEPIQGGLNLNLLFRAPSGYGKTCLAINSSLTFANHDCNNIEYLLPNESGNISINPNKRFHIIDEAHLLKNQELLYPAMDSHKHFFYILTNESGELKEPLQNRCINFIFHDYTEEELIEIIKDSISSAIFKLDTLELKEIVRNCNGNPRIAKQIISRLYNLFSTYGTPRDYHDITYLIENILQIQDGLNLEHRRYLDFLKSAKTASLDLISLSTRIDKSTIRRDIEPVLIYKNLIKITSKGRTYNGV